MKTIEELQAKVIAGETDWLQYGNVNVNENPDGSLLIFSYSNAAQYERRWNWFERVSRGLIMNRETGEVVARPFDKFFNWGELGHTRKKGLKEVTTKMDGSLGILYRHNDKLLIATRGSFDGDQALWATGHINHFMKQSDFSLLPNELTLLFEIIYPENRIVVDYGRKEGLVLLGVRNRFTGDDFFVLSFIALAQALNLETARTHYNFSGTTQLLELAKELPGNEEGWVLRFTDGMRLKIKGDRYKEIHRLISVASFKHVLQAVSQGTLKEFIGAVPDEFLGNVKLWQGEIEGTVDRIQIEVSKAYAVATKGTRKDYALWVQENHQELAPYLFATLDKRAITPLIYKHAFKDREMDCPKTG